MSPTLHAALSSKLPKLAKKVVQWPHLGKLLIIQAELNEKEDNIDMKNDLLNEGRSFASLRPIPDVPSDFSLEKLYIKPQILSNINDSLSKLDGNNKVLSPIQKELLTIISNYHVSYLRLCFTVKLSYFV